MKPLSSTKIFGVVFVLTTIIMVLEGSSLYSDAFGQRFEDQKKYDMILLSQKYNSIGLFADELVGEILNNGTATIKAVEITAIFSDDQDNIIGNERSGTSPYTIHPGDTASFTIEIFDDAVKINASSYDFTVKWKDEYLSINYFTRLAGDEISDDNSEGDDNDNDDDDN